MSSKSPARLPPHEKRCTHINEDGSRCPRKKADDLPVCQECFDRTLDERAKGNPVTGRRMRALGRLKNDYALAESNPEILRHEPVIALHDVRLIELIQRLEGGDTANFREKLLELFRRWDIAIANGDEKDAGKAYQEMGKLIEDGVARDKAWEAVLSLGARRNQLATQAAEIMLKSEQVVNQKDLAKLIKTFITIVLEEAPREVAFAIVNKFDREGMGRLNAGDPGEARSDLSDAVRKLPGAPSSVLSGSLGSGPLGETGADR